MSKEWGDKTRSYLGNNVPPMANSAFFSARQMGEDGDTDQVFVVKGNTRTVSFGLYERSYTYNSAGVLGEQGDTITCPITVSFNCPISIYLEETYQFTVIPEPGVISPPLGTTFRWVLLSGSGSITSGGLYTAPTETINCSFPTVGLQCALQSILEWKTIGTCSFLIEPAACSGTILIGATISNMLPGESQTLTMIYEAPNDGNFCGVEQFVWSLSGGGTLTDNVTSAIYTAPGDNADCLNNGTISLSCNGIVKDSVTINTTVAWAPAPIAYYKPTIISPYPGGSACSVSIKYEAFNCLGVSGGLVGCTTCQKVFYDNCFGCTDGTYKADEQTGCTDVTKHIIPDYSSVPCTPEVWSARCTAYNGCGIDGATGIPISCSANTEVRSVAAKHAGCCPWDLN